MVEVISKPSVETLLDNLQARYLRAVDAQDMDAWLECFSTDDEASYICTSAENERNGLELALVYDDCRDRLIDRVAVITKVWKGTYHPYRTRHLAQRVYWLEERPGLWAMESHFMITASREGESPYLLTSGIYRDMVQVRNDHALLLKRKAVYDADILPHYSVFPF
jgi:anthranilate 1,2-dioxygenase small subunit